MKLFNIFAFAAALVSCALGQDSGAPDPVDPSGAVFKPGYTHHRSSDYSPESDGDYNPPSPYVPVYISPEQEDHEKPPKYGLGLYDPPKPDYDPPSSYNPSYDTDTSDYNDYEPDKYDPDKKPDYELDDYKDSTDDDYKIPGYSKPSYESPDYGGKGYYGPECKANNICKKKGYKCCACADCTSKNFGCAQTCACCPPQSICCKSGIHKHVCCPRGSQCHMYRGACIIVKKIKSKKADIMCAPCDYDDQYEPEATSDD